jgi:hypothetical protein
MMAAFVEQFVAPLIRRMSVDNPLWGAPRIQYRAARPARQSQGNGAAIRSRLRAAFATQGAVE